MLNTEERVRHLEDKGKMSNIHQIELETRESGVKGYI